jgi:tRNA (guanine37-N1)-methyltransferase
MPKPALSIKTPKKQGERTIALAAQLGLFDKSLEIGREDCYLYVPLARQPDETELAVLKREMVETQLESRDFVEKQPSAKTLSQILENKLPPHLLDSLPQALDVIGDIAIIEIPAELKPHEKLIGDAILQTHRNIKTVLAKAGAVSGTYRVRELAFLAGEKKTRTVHKEFGCQYFVDVAKAYFSPRLSHEHMRVASLVEPGEVVSDLFAGVGPFSVLIGKIQPNAKVYAVDINPDAVELLKTNVRVNRVDGRVFPILGDARELAATKLSGTADRIIMNLPETAIDFVDAACQAVKPQGGIIHFYGFVRQPDSAENLKHRFTQAVELNGRKVREFPFVRNVRETAPFESQIVLDAKIV